MESGINGLEFIDETKKSTISNTNHTQNTCHTPWANAIKNIAHILLAVHLIGGFILFNIFADNYSTRELAWITIVLVLTYAILYYPLIIGFSKIVVAAEKYLGK